MQSTVGWLSSFLIPLNACCWASVHCQMRAFFSNSRNGCVIWARLGENLPNWFTIPRKRLNSGIVRGGSMFCIAAVFSGSARMPVSSMM